ncbi:thioredoxin family protein [Robertkochia aurantiaca]|uniref:thioredoxin family protein n=1 Tax=Robertkochia aurantiaca TaxID=2873700 RepID=UPI001CC95788|nr:thioredoxin family protein [Robertkochia sp. 3YJGBD-33]
MSEIRIEFFTSPRCGICQALKPKLLRLLEEEFPDIPMEITDSAAEPEKAAQALIFTAPVLRILLDGREQQRFAHAFSIDQVRSTLLKVSKQVK